MPSLRLGEAASEFTDVTSTDQFARAGVTAWRHCPVIAGCATAPDPPLRVVPPELLKLGILIVPASVGVHGVRLQAAGGRPRSCRSGWARAWTAGWAMQLPPSRRSAVAAPRFRQRDTADDPPGHPARHLAAGWGRSGHGRLARAAMMLRCQRRPSHALSLNRDWRWGQPGPATGLRPGPAARRRRPDSGPGPSPGGQPPERSQRRRLLASSPGSAGPSRSDQVSPAAPIGGGDAAGDHAPHRLVVLAAEPGGERNRASHHPKRAARCSRYTRPCGTGPRGHNVTPRSPSSVFSSTWALIWRGTQ